MSVFTEGSCNHMVLLYIVAFHRSWEGLELFLGWELLSPTPTGEIAPRKKTLPPPIFFIYFITKITKGWSNSTISPPQLPLEASGA